MSIETELFNLIKEAVRQVIHETMLEPTTTNRIAWFAEPSEKINLPRFWTLAECATELKIDAGTIQKWAVSGRIPAAKVGREWRFCVVDVLAWFRQGGTDVDLIHAQVGAELAARRASPLDEEKTWGAKECAEYFGISSSTIYTLAMQKKIPCFHVGKRVRFRPHEIRAWAGTDGSIKTKAQLKFEAELDAIQQRGNRRRRKK